MKLMEKEYNLYMFKYMVYILPYLRCKQSGWKYPLLDVYSRNTNLTTAHPSHPLAKMAAS